MVTHSFNMFEFLFHY
ncbi:CRISPR-associated DxTHG motif protein [uncultured Draconibacterium sp.]